MTVVSPFSVGWTVRDSLKPMETAATDASTQQELSVYINDEAIRTFVTKKLDAEDVQGLKASSTADSEHCRLAPVPFESTRQIANFYFLTSTLAIGHGHREALIRLFGRSSSATTGFAVCNLWRDCPDHSLDRPYLHSFLERCREPEKEPHLLHLTLFGKERPTTPLPEEAAYWETADDLAGDYLKLLTEIVTGLEKRDCADFFKFAEKVKQSSQGSTSVNPLIEAVISTFPSYRDTAFWRGREVWFLKKAQLLAHDLYKHLPVEFPFSDLQRELCIFADNAIPCVLAAEGMLVVSPRLQRDIDTLQPLAEEDIALLRGLSICAADRIVAVSQERQRVKDETESQFLLPHCGVLDEFLFALSRREEYKHLRRHRNVGTLAY
uniref:Queuosine 5'-phosphate N-glycosylase/hydrolase n=1 Tax=Chromera velia CCMP2878 TaxID=1169474 RepID=A0A0G4HQS9_9ALVE|eukprot:Cvel_7961.t1-p1 / transcript=Cvel_7961.t1 / gene=Cvel_7961 / organism=Chromera_velia_CCMP2878 / gene_product=hypothetical protein / transcript_product=hypothetical protein / location=Cvel_scaffold428:63004-64333(+) / protein_length=380 / sequence_SO=supercontig / SO=protein_coding / is_pseudo=false